MLNNFLPEFTFQYDSLCEKNMCTDLLSYFYVGSLFIFYPQNAQLSISKSSSQKYLMSKTEKKSIYTPKCKFCFLPTCECLVTTIFHSSQHKCVYQQANPFVSLSQVSFSDHVTYSVGICKLFKQAHITFSDGSK